MKDIFAKAESTWSSMEPFRSERSRCKRYVYGEQWDDMLNLGGQHMTERQFILRQGQVPLKNNILRRVLRNVVGLYRSRYKVPLLSSKDSGLKGAQLRDANNARLRWFQQNRMEQLAPRLLEEFLISGLVAVRVDGVDIHSVTPDNFFFHSDGYDPRGLDVDMVGEVHRVSLSTLIERFCTSADDYRRIHAIYGDTAGGGAGCRVTEVWHKEIEVFAIIHDERTATLRLRRMADIISPMHGEYGVGKSDAAVRSVVRSGWRRYWFAHDGTLLREDERRERHPYVYKAYPFIDGEVHSYISDIIDQQRYVNRLITLYDYVMKSSAKGVTLVLV